MIVHYKKADGLIIGIVHAKRKELMTPAELQADADTMWGGLYAGAIDADKVSDNTLAQMRGIWNPVTHEQTSPPPVPPAPKPNPNKPEMLRLRRKLAGGTDLTNEELRWFLLNAGVGKALAGE